MRSDAMRLLASSSAQLGLWSGGLAPLLLAVSRECAAFVLQASCRRVCEPALPSAPNAGADGQGATG